jgi:hypothetical protein
VFALGLVLAKLTPGLVGRASILAVTAALFVGIVMPHVVRDWIERIRTERWKAVADLIGASLFFGLVTVGGIFLCAELAARIGPWALAHGFIEPENLETLVAFRQSEWSPWLRALPAERSPTWFWLGVATVIGVLVVAGLREGWKSVGILVMGMSALIPFLAIAGLVFGGIAWLVVLFVV